MEIQIKPIDTNSGKPALTITIVAFSKIVSYKTYVMEYPTDMKLYLKHIDFIKVAKGNPKNTVLYLNSDDRFMKVLSHEFCNGSVIEEIMGVGILQALGALEEKVLMYKEIIDICTKQQRIDKEVGDTSF